MPKVSSEKEFEEVVLGPLTEADRQETADELRRLFNRLCSREKPKESN